MTQPPRPARFTIVGENIHTTRVVMRQGTRVTTLEDGTEAVRFRDSAGKSRLLTIPAKVRDTQAYQQGQIKHVMIAAQKGLGSDSAAQEEGAEYVRDLARRQMAAGAHSPDLNVDEISPRLEIQKAAMQWLVGIVQGVSTIPLSIDSSNSEIIETGLAAYNRGAGRPLLNSVALERLDTLDMARQYDAQLIATAAGSEGMPSDDEERVANVKEVIRHAGLRGIPLADIHVDALVFPISVDPRYGNHYLDAVQAIRKTYGPEIQITGGLSNVSFGLPNRKLVNVVFIALAIDAGIDGAIMDPVATKIDDVLSVDRETEPYRLAAAMLLGEDEYCVNYIQAWRAGKLG